MAGKPNTDSNFSPRMQSLMQRWQLCREMELEELAAEMEKGSSIDAAHNTLHTLYALNNLKQPPAHLSAQNEMIRVRKITIPAA